jgi:hypothetical protein
MHRKRLTFELARFAWGAPDRLELSGRFVGLADGPAEIPELVISGANGVHRLPVVSDSLSGALEDGRWWDAVFAWQEPPVAFDLAELRFGSDMVVELPTPDARRSRSKRQTLAVSREPVEEEGEEAAPPVEEEEIAEPAGIEHVRAHAELLGTQETLHEARAALERNQEELARARSDLAAEREARSGDGDRFQRALGELREAAEEALTAEQAATREVRGELQEALEMIANRDAETESLRQRVAELEALGAEADGLRGELDTARADAESARTEREQAWGALEEAREDAQRLLERLDGARHTAGDAA